MAARAADVRAEVDFDVLSSTVAERWTRWPARRSRGTYGPRLDGIHPHLPAAGLRLPLVVKAIGAAATELGVAKVGDSAEH